MQLTVPSCVSQLKSAPLVPPFNPMLMDVRRCEAPAFLLLLAPPAPEARGPDDDDARRDISWPCPAATLSAGLGHLFGVVALRVFGLLLFITCVAWHMISLHMRSGELGKKV